MIGRRNFYKILCALGAIFFTGAIPYEVSALDPDWTGSRPLVARRESVAAGLIPWNECSFGLVNYVAPNSGGAPSQISMCITDGDGFRLAEVGSNLGGRVVAVSIGLDNNFYDLSYDGRQSGWPLVLASGSKKFVIAEYLADRTAYLNSYTNLLSGLERTATGYYLNKQMAGEMMVVPSRVFGWGISSSGRYIAYGEQLGSHTYNVFHRLILVDTETGSQQMFGVSGSIAFSDPESAPLMRVSDDGQLIFEAWLGAAKVWRVSDSCLRQYSVGSQLSLIDHCPGRFFVPDYPGSPGGDYIDVGSLRIKDDLSEIGYVHNATSGSALEMIFLKAANFRPSEGMDYLALGDSYSSGEGDVGGDFYLVGTKEPGECHISSRSYPFLLGKKWNIPAHSMRSVACSGAQMTYDYMFSMENYLGQDQQLKGLSDSARAESRTKAIDEFTPGLVPQLEFIKKYKPKTMTLTGGGNDVGFADILRYCASPTWAGLFVDDTCSYAKDERARKTLVNTIHNQYGIMRYFLRKAKEASPETKIYLIGYPQFIAQPAIVCSYNGASLNSRERQMIRDMVQELNNVLWRAATDEGVAFIDVEDALKGGQICEGSRYMTGLLDVGVGNLMRSNVVESFHPNSAGHSRLADKIALGIGQSTEAYRPASAGGVYVASPKSSRVSMALDSILRSRLLRIDLPAATLSPLGLVVLTIFSDPVDLGAFTVEADGSLGVEVVLPDDVGPGEHMLLLEGETYSGEPISLYQHITISAADGDMDGDGIPDEFDQCNFINTWVDESSGLDICRAAGGSAADSETGSMDDLGSLGVVHISDPLLASTGFRQYIVISSALALVIVSLGLVIRRIFYD